MVELLLIPVCFFSDQLTKNKAEKELINNEKKPLFGGKLHLQIVYNKGAFLGLLKRHKKVLMATNVFSIAILAFIIGGLVFMKGQHLIKVGISLMAGGAFGNIYDRFKRGKVVDFFAFALKPNIYFNLADMFVFLGAFVAVLGTIFLAKKPFL